MAKVYDRGRSLPSGSIRLFADAAYRHFPGGGQPVFGLGAETGRVPGPLRETMGGLVVGLEPATSMLPAAAKSLSRCGGPAHRHFGDSFMAVWAREGYAPVR